MIHSLTAVIILATGYLVYRSLPGIRFLKKKFFPEPGNNESEIYFRRLFSALIYGAIPVIIVILSGNDPGKYGMKFQNAAFTIISGLFTGILLMAVNLINYRKPDNLAAFPEIRKKEWDIRTLLYSAITWTIYLLGYEILFRGYMLFRMTEFTGRWPAIAINVFLYSLVHFHKGWKEAVGAVPLGIVLCLLCLKAGSFWPAFIAHLFLALSNEWLSLKAHPEIKIKHKLK